MKKKALAVLATLLLSICAVIVGGVVTAPVKTEAATKKVSITKKKATLKVGESFRLKLKNASGTIKWKATGKAANGKAVVSVTKKGTVKALNEGTAVVKATYKGKTYKCTITVSPAVKEAEVVTTFDFRYSARISNVPGTDKYDKLINLPEVVYYGDVALKPYCSELETAGWEVVEMDEIGYCYYYCVSNKGLTLVGWEFDEEIDEYKLFNWDTLRADMDSESSILSNVSYLRTFEWLRPDGTIAELGSDIDYNNVEIWSDGTWHLVK